jgi:hypothetical protein
VCDFTNYRVLEKMQLYERRLENSLHKTRAELEKLQAARRARHKASQQSAPADDQVNLKKQSQSPAFGGKSEALNPKHALSNVDGSETIASCAVDLKKQSQFSAAQINANCGGKMGCDDMSDPDSAADKSSQPCPEDDRGGRIQGPSRSDSPVTG